MPRTDGLRPRVSPDHLPLKDLALARDGCSEDRPGGAHTSGGQARPTRVHGRPASGGRIAASKRGRLAGLAASSSSKSRQLCCFRSRSSRASLVWGADETGLPNPRRR